MTKRELIDRIAAEEGATKAEVESIVDAFLEQVAATLQTGEGIALPGFGSFEVRDRAARTGRNPQTGAELDIPAAKATAFKAATALKRRVNTA